MTEKKDVKGDAGHGVCHNPCKDCRGQGFLENGEICPTCAGTGCKDQKLCEPAGGLGCDRE